jgi:uncharacterized protein
MTDLSVDARLLATERGAAPPTNTWVVILASAVLGSGAIALGDAYTWRQGALFLLGGALGVVLYHALFASPRHGGYSSPTAAAPACARRC